MCEKVIQPIDFPPSWVGVGIEKLRRELAEVMMLPKEFFEDCPKERSIMKLNVQAIFDSIDGEENGFGGAGELTTFIRLKGCNLECSYCDTKYAQGGSPENWMTIEQILQEVHFPKVTITGGEPLLQKPAVSALCNRLISFHRYHAINGHSRVSIETNGTIVPTYYARDVKYIVDYKLPSSGMEAKMVPRVFKSLGFGDVIKFVIANEVDYRRACDLIKINNWNIKSIFSPALDISVDDDVCKNCGGHEVHVGSCYNCGTSAGKRFIMDWPRQLAEMMIRDRVPAQFGLQLHKILWPKAKEER